MMRRLFSFSSPTYRWLSLVVLALAVLLLLLTVAVPVRAAAPQRSARVVAARQSSAQPAMNATPPSGVMGPSQRAPVRLRP
jgi:hypothetical protein